jgi:hypothetical protein
MKKENAIFKALGLILLILILGFFASCEKTPFVEKPMYFQGTFILNNDSNGRMCYTCQTQKWWSN